MGALHNTVKNIFPSSFPPNHYRVLYSKKYFFYSMPKVFDFRFCPVYITVTLGPSVLEWAWRSARCCRVLWEIVIRFRERNSSFTFWKCTRIILFSFFLKETSEQHQGRLLVVVTFLFIFFRRVLSLAESFPGMITNWHRAAYIAHSCA